MMKEARLAFLAIALMMCFPSIPVFPDGAATPDGVTTHWLRGDGSFASNALSFTATAKTSSFSAVAGNAYAVSTASGAVTCTLPTASGIAGQEIIVWISANGNNLTFNTTSSQTISGQASGAIASGITYNLYRFIADPSGNWIIE